MMATERDKEERDRGRGGWRSVARAGISLAVAMGVLAIALPAVAQFDSQEPGCREWTRAFVCDVEMRFAKPGESWRTFEPYRPTVMAPGETMRLEVVGRDAQGQLFPPERIAFGMETRDCDGLLTVHDEGQGRFTVEAASATGSCEWLLWIPGNLNLEWRMQVEVLRPARTGYDRAEAEALVGDLYQAILGREPDPEGFAAAVQGVQGGRVEAQVLSIVRSPEFANRRSELGAGELLESFYQGLLDRSPDSDGVRLYLPLLQQERYTEVILRLIRSDEYEQRLDRRGDD